MTARGSYAQFFYQEHLDKQEKFYFRLYLKSIRELQDSK
jgi:hypothetical protein